MRILFVHNRYRQWGGEDTAVTLESNLLREKGHEVEILYFSNEALGEGAAGKTKALLQAIYNKESKQKLSEAIHRFRPALVHVHNLFFEASPAILDAAAAARVPVVMTLHNYRLICCNALLLRDNRPCERCVNKALPLDGIRFRCYRSSAAASAMVTLTTGLHKLRHTWQDKVSAFIVLTDFARTRFLGSSLRATPEQLVVKPNFVPDRGTGPAVREPFFLFAGRLSAEKGVFTLLEAVSGLLQIQLRVAGEGPERAAAEEKYGGNPNIRFLGPLDAENLRREMQTCLALVIPSVWYEGLPYVILEAFSAGTPVIASRIGALTAIVTEGVNGCHFEAGNVSELRDRLTGFAKNAIPLYTGARQTYLDRYHPDAHYAAVMQIYRQVAGQRLYP